MAGEAKSEEQQEALGVCATAANWVDVDPFLVRVNAVLLGLFATPIVIVAYVIAGVLIGSPKVSSLAPARLKGWELT